MLAAGPEPVDLEMVTQIRQEGFRNSQVMNILGTLTDRMGARVTGSPSLKKANEWSRDKLTEYGLANAHLEAWGPFGRGWAEESTSVRMIAPDVSTLFALPRAWTPSTNGTVRGKVVRFKADRPEDLEKYRGKLAGMILLVGESRDVKEQTQAASVRLTNERLTEIAQYGIPNANAGRGGMDPQEYLKSQAFRRTLNKFLEEEKALAIIEPSRFDGGAVTMAGGGSNRNGEPVGVPALNMAVEHWGRIYRLVEQQVPVELELNVKSSFYDNDEMAYNTIADIPGTDKKDEYVILGAHIDSWHGGTGATDNAAGVAVVMEAARILKALGVKPRRTIRVALWSGEEQGLLGSRAYVDKHIATFPEPTDPKERELPSWLRRPAGPPEQKADYKKVSAYFNLDNGTGKIRGIYCQENAAACPIFGTWLEPLKDLGATTVTLRNTGGTDHQPFDRVGVPGFQFIQDPVEYFTRTHHTNMDVYERVQRDDLMQAAVVMASFAYHAAMREQMIPRKPLPRVEQRQATTQQGSSVGGGK